MTDRATVFATLAFAVVMLAVFVFVAARRPATFAESAATESITYRIDPNRADLPELCLMPGIAGGKARAIIEDRRLNGAFASAEDLERVRGIGAKTRAGFEPWIAIQSSPAVPPQVRE